MKIADEKLVSATLNGDRTAFGMLVRKYQSTVYGLIYSLIGNFSEAQDLTQEAFIRAYLDLHQLRERAKFAAWLRKVARNACRMWLRRQRTSEISIENSMEAIENGEPNLYVSQHDPAEIAERRELRQAVLSAVDSLQEPDQTAISLFYIDGLTYQEISEFLDISVSAIQSRLHRARKKLKGELLNMVQEAFAENRIGDEFTQKVLHSISTFNEIHDMALSHSGNNLWCATYGGVVKFDIGASSFTKYTTADGLRDNTVMSLALDSLDRLWCATAGGLCMFDGEKWKNCPDLPPDIGVFSGDMDDITVDARDTIWLSTHGWVWKGKTSSAVCKLEGDSWKIYPIGEELEGIGPSIYTDREGRIWYGARHGVSMLRDEEWVTHLLERGGESNHVSSILQDSQGSMWFGTKRGVWKFEGSDWTIYSSDEGLRPGRITALAEDRDSSVLAGGGKGLFSFDGERWTQHSGEDMPTSRITAIVVDDQGNKWISTARKGLYKFDGAVWTRYSVIKTLPGSYISGVLVDKQDDLWIATSSSGVAKYDGQTWQYYSHAKDISLDTAAMFMDSSGSLWFGTPYGGVCMREGDEWKIYREEAKGSRLERQESWIESIAQDRFGNLWFATMGKGVWKYDGEEWTQFTVNDGLPVDIIYALFIDSGDIVWAGTSNGLCKYDGKSWTSVAEKGSPVDEHIFCIVSGNDQDIWFGAWKGGAYRYNGKSWRCYTDRDGLAGNYVLDIALDRGGRLWFGTNSGLSCFDGQSWISYGTEHGLASRCIYSLAIDKKNVLHIGTMGGLSHMEL